MSESENVTSKSTGDNNNQSEKNPTPEKSEATGAAATTSTESESQAPTPQHRNLRRGKCKWFNVTKGWGFITPEDGSQDVFVHQSVLDMTGFRSLGEDEIVEFESKETDKGVEATLVTGPDSANLQGSKPQRSNKKRYRKTRCYNCGEFANHIAADCTLETQPKKCHHCKSAEHLMADCPLAESKRAGRERDEKQESS